MQQAYNPITPTQAIIVADIEKDPDLSDNERANKLNVHAHTVGRIKAMLSSELGVPEQQSNENLQALSPITGISAKATLKSRVDSLLGNTMELLERELLFYLDEPDRELKKEDWKIWKRSKPDLKTLATVASQLMAQSDSLDTRSTNLSDLLTMGEPALLQELKSMLRNNPELLAGADVVIETVTTSGEVPSELGASIPVG